MTVSSVLRLRPNPGAQLGLFCFPSAGSGPAMFRTWADAFAPEIEVIGVQVPGREAQMSQPLIDDFGELCRAIGASLDPFLDRPFAFFGHSMGAWIGIEVTRSLHRRGRHGPEHFLVSGRRAPQLPERHSLMHQLADQPLVEAIQERYGGIPEAVLAEPELMDLMLPILRADLKALETHVVSPEPPITCPITCFGGLKDTQVERWELEAWSEQTGGAFRSEMFEGGHFYFQDPSVESSLLESISNDLEAVLERLAS